MMVKQRLITCYVLLIQLHRKLVEIENREQINNDISGRIFTKVLQNEVDSKNQYNQLKVVSTQGDTLPIFHRSNSKIFAVCMYLFAKKVLMNKLFLKP